MLLQNRKANQADNHNPCLHYIQLILQKLFSSTVNEAIRTYSSLFIIFFKEKISTTQKRKTSKKQLTKQKQANIKQQKQQFFCTQQLLRGEKLFILRLFFTQFFLKKINRLKTVLIASFNVLLTELKLS